MKRKYCSFPALAAAFAVGAAVAAAAAACWICCGRRAERGAALGGCRTSRTLPRILDAMIAADGDDEL